MTSHQIGENRTECFHHDNLDNSAFSAPSARDIGSARGVHIAATAFSMMNHYIGFSSMKNEFLDTFLILSTASFGL